MSDDQRTPNPTPRPADIGRAANVCDYVRMGAGRDDIRDRVLRFLQEVRAEEHVAAHVAGRAKERARIVALLETGEQELTQAYYFGRAVTVIEEDALLRGESPVTNEAELRFARHWLAWMPEDHERAAEALALLLRSGEPSNHPETSNSSASVVSAPTDEERARAWVLDHEQTPYKEDIGSLASEFAAVRAEERAKSEAQREREWLERHLAPVVSVIETPPARSPLEVVRDGAPKFRPPAVDPSTWVTNCEPEDAERSIPVVLDGVQIGETYDCEEPGCCRPYDDAFEAELRENGFEHVKQCKCLCILTIGCAEHDAPRRESTKSFGADDFELEDGLSLNEVCRHCGAAREGTATFAVSHYRSCVVFREVAALRKVAKAAVDVVADAVTTADHDDVLVGRELMDALESAIEPLEHKSEGQR